MILRLVDALTEGALTVDGWFAALIAALVISGLMTLFDVVLGSNDDDAYALRVVHRIAKKSPDRVETDVPGILYLEIDGLSKPVLQRAMRDGNAPNMARWLAEGTHRLVEWEPDLSSQTGASQAGILLGSNEDIPAFRWVEKERGELMVCSNPDDCAEIERRHAGNGLLRNGGASRGNLLSGEADHVLLTASRVSEEKKANPGYRAFFANGFNVTRSLALVVWEVILEVVASARQRRRDVRPRGHRGGIYPLLRAGMCVVVRDLTVYAVLTDIMIGRPAIYATFASYDEVAHHSGPRASGHARGAAKARPAVRPHRASAALRARPYDVVVLSDHGQTQGATFKQRNGFGLDELVARVGRGDASPRRRGRGREQDERRRRLRRGDRSGRRVGEEAIAEEGRQRPGGRRPRLGQPRPHLPDGRASEADAGGDRGAPSSADPGAARRTRTSASWSDCRPSTGCSRSGSDGTRFLADDRVEGRDPLADFAPTAARAPAPLGRVRARARPLRQQLLRP